MREIKFRAKFKDGSGWMYWEARSALYPDETDTKAEEIDLETIGQFTGLHDKNGKEIYEGEILQWGTPRFPNGQIAEVSWDAEKARFLWEYVGLTKNQCKKLSVIGNIYETPELLTAPHNH